MKNIRCKAQNKNGKPCSNNAIEGSDFCHIKSHNTAKLPFQIRLSNFIQKHWSVIILVFVLALAGFMLTFIQFPILYFYDKTNNEIQRKKAEDQFRNAGTLKSQTILSTQSKIFPKLEIGDSGSVFEYGGNPNEPLFVFFDSMPLFVKNVDGQIKVNTTIKSRKGGIVVELIDNEWKSNPQNWDRNYSKDSLEVKDDQGDIVFQLRVLSDRVQLQAIYYDGEGFATALFKDRDGHGVMMPPFKVGKITNPPLIEPIFAYPSDLHLGELLR